MFVIKYTVDGFPGEHTAGPYTAIEVGGHRADIEGYEGVKNVRVEPAPAKSSENSQ
jgi:hypothetical protein